MCKGNKNPKEISNDIINSEELAEEDLLDGEAVGIIFELIFHLNASLTQIQIIFFTQYRKHYFGKFAKWKRMKQMALRGCSC
jgi:hypothetical protein